MATRFIPNYSRATVPPPLHHRRTTKYPFSINSPCLYKARVINSKIRAASDSYLDMWKKAVDRERSSTEFQKTAEESSETDEELAKKREIEFKKLLEVSPEERDRIQRTQVVDRAAAAIEAARALIRENAKQEEYEEEDPKEDSSIHNGSSFSPQSVTLTPGPSFWSWTPPIDSNADGKSVNTYKSPSQSVPLLLEKERSSESFSIPFETSMLQIPPLQSSVETEEKSEIAQHEISVEFSSEVAHALSEMTEMPSDGIDNDGSKWWKETGVEQRADGVVCKWTLIRGVSTIDKRIEWENKYWEASDKFGYKELGSEKSGRDVEGNVWGEFWKESMSQQEGIVHLEKSADKWGKNLFQGSEWQEKWWEHYDASGKAEKWAHKWCTIDPNTPLEDGHAHIWNERWGETYNGEGGSTKYTDKWSERFEFDGWSKWGDKWDENFDIYGHGVKQGEKWWKGKNGDRWNRTWGEAHNGSGWVHKYGKSSDGEHWDNHQKEETWYQRFPHFGFDHCFENSRHLREVKIPSQWVE